MKKKVTFYHANCPVCVSAEQAVVGAIDTSRFDVEIVNLGNSKDRLAEAERAGVKPVPALVMDGQVFHIDFGAGLSHLK
ncbi:MAG: thioredoxin family protein [Thermogutta sp.]